MKHFFLYFEKCLNRQATVGRYKTSHIISLTMPPIGKKTNSTNRQKWFNFLMAFLNHHYPF